MRALKTVFGTGFAVAFISFATACTLASPSYYDSQEADKTEGGEAEAEANGGGESTPQDNNSKATGAACATDDFIKPDLSKLTACGDGKGHCYDKDKSPLNDLLVACPGNSNQVCVPDDILKAGGAKPKTCASIIGAGGCATFKLMPSAEKEAGGALKQDVCEAGQVCAPCTDPTDNNAPTPFCQPIGVHEKACAASEAPAGGGGDGGGGTPTAAAGCCTTKGKSNGTCISESAIPEDQRGDTKQDSCSTGNKCVPTAFVQNKPVKCDTGIPFIEKGVCLDKCFDSMLAAAGTIGALSRDKCGSTELCVPCKALEGQGAPGCE